MEINKHGMREREICPETVIRSGAGVLHPVLKDMDGNDFGG
jgi:hypothetical protein